MSAPVFLGDEISAAGYRLAGAVVRTPQAGQESAALAWARERASMVLVSAPVAASIDAAELRAAVAAGSPLVLVVPDLQGGSAPPDVALRLRAQLGLES